MQTLGISFRDEGVGGPHGEGEFGYGNGWMPIGDCSICHYHRLICELRYEDHASYFNFLRVPPEMFDELLDRLGPLITKQDTPIRKALEPGLKLAMTMRHLASGNRYASMKFDFRVPHNTMYVCVREV